MAEHEADIGFVDALNAMDADSIQAVFADEAQDPEEDDHGQTENVDNEVLADQLEELLEMGGPGQAQDALAKRIEELRGSD